MINRMLVLLSLLVVTTAVWSADDAKAREDIRAALAGVMPQAPDSIEPSVVPGLYEVAIGAQVFYMSADGKYFFQGDIFDIKSRVNITDDHRSGGRKKIIDGIKEDTMIVFTPKEVKHVVTVFTDVDCGYCRKLHSEIDTYLKEGIKIRYLAFPRSGIGSPSYDKAVSVWCAADKQSAMTKAKAGGQVAKMDKECANPVKDHYNAGGALGVTGTPTLVFSNGKVIPGYLPADRLRQELEKENL